MTSFSIEPDPLPRRGPWHKKIKAIHPIRDTRTGNQLTLECGHVVQSFGDLNRSDSEGLVLCTQCRDASQNFVRRYGSG